MKIATRGTMHTMGERDDDVKLKCITESERANELKSSDEERDAARTNRCGKTRGRMYPRSLGDRKKCPTGL
jgi:hypothetical protein